MIFNIDPITLQETFAPIEELSNPIIQTEWKHNLIAICPVGLFTKANQLAMAVGDSTGDGNTFVSVTHAGDNELDYAIIPFVAKDAILTDISLATILRPSWDFSAAIDINAANEIKNGMTVIPSQEALDVLTSMPAGLILGINISKEALCAKWNLLSITSGV